MPRRGILIVHSRSEGKLQRMRTMLGRLDAIEAYEHIKALSVRIDGPGGKVPGVEAGGMTHAGLLSEYPGWAGKLDPLDVLEPCASRAAAHSAPGCLPGGLFENKQCRFPAKNISIVSNFAHTASVRSHSINPALTHQPSGQIPGCPNPRARGTRAQFSEGGHRFLRTG
jgi:hypothetical protein